MIEFLPQLIVTYVTYLVATASPGPATLAIMGSSMQKGRPAGLALAAGVISGSLIWGLLAAFGLAGLLAEYGAALIYVKIAGGLYLLWLAWKSLKSAATNDQKLAVKANVKEVADLKKQYFKGLAIHLTNPKAVFAWSAIITLGLDSGMPVHAPAWVLGGCAILGVMVFGGYALLFSTAIMIRLYGQARRGIEAVLGLVFCFAGLRLLNSGLDREIA